MHGDKLDPTPVQGVPRCRAGLSGLFDIALHPPFATNHFVISHLRQAPRSADAGNGLARGVWDVRRDQRPRDFFDHRHETVSTDHFAATACSTCRPGATVPISRRRPTASAQSLRLRDDGTVPPDNPLSAKAGYRPESTRSAHAARSASRCIRHGPDLGEREGPNGGDEINVLVPRQYGWPLVSLGARMRDPAVAEGLLAKA